MLRVHFTPEDLTRTVVCADPDPLWEVLLSGFRLQERRPPLGFRPWLDALATDRSGIAATRRGIHVLRVLAPMGPYFPDFLTPAAARLGLDDGLDALCGTPQRELRGQLETLARWKRLPGWVRPLADGDVTAVTKLAFVLREFHNAAIAPHRDVVGRPVTIDYAHRLGAFTSGGLEGLFDSMRPLLRWQPPVLEVEYSVDRELNLDGRGLRLVPSYFCHRVPVSFADSGLPPTLVYPVDQEFRWRTTRSTRSLDALLGTTRSAVLHAIAHGATTSQLARRLDTSVSSVSRHAAVLRGAGLVASQRQNQAVFHSVTPLGAAMLERT
ncbi:winged helix-turn-helix transcriptional regulator [Amycolatopsis sp. H6(2020)]|nr:winged helix-turn-helix transcriptional regulator [Amycolatopsis sp. H6(2020)]